MSAAAVADFLAEATAAGAAGPALATPEGVWSYAGLSDRVDERAAELRRAGVRRGAVHPVVLESDGEGIATLLALWRVGAVPAPLNPRLTDAERREAVDALDGWSGFAQGSTGSHRAGGAGGPLSVPQAILWTSGTSGRPRGISLSADNLRASARAVAARLRLGPGDVWLSSLSMAHVGGLALVVRALLLGGSVTACGRFEAAKVSALLDGDGLPPGAPGPVTHLSLVPTQLLRLLEVRKGAPSPPTLRCVLIGGAHAPSELVRRALDDGFPLALTYGMTEMTSQVATAPPVAARRKPGSVGRPLDGVEVRIAPDGEVLVRGPTLAMGVEADSDGWYHTGDLGTLDDDGDLWITGRRSDRIVSGGVTVDAQEVEGVLRTHPAIADACVVGVPDAEWGESVAAAVVAFEAGFDADAASGWLRQRLSAAKRPRHWLQVDHLPLNANGKVDRGAVRGLFG